MHVTINELITSIYRTPSLSIVMNMHKRVVFFVVMFVFTLNDLKQ